MALGLVEVDSQKFACGPRADVTACTVEERGGIAGAAVREWLAPVGAVGRSVRLRQSADTVVVQAEHDLDSGALGRRQDVIVRLIDCDGADLERANGLQIRVETRLAVCRAGGQYTRGAGCEGELRVAGDRRGRAPVVVAAPALWRIVNVNSAEGGRARRRTGACLRAAATATAPGGSEKNCGNKEPGQFQELAACRAGISVASSDSDGFYTVAGALS